MAAKVRGWGATAVLATVVLGGTAGARAGSDSPVASPGGGDAAATAVADPLPFFSPDPKPTMYGPPLPDPEVPECAASDRQCLEAHDAAALSAALAEQDDASCDNSRHPDACRAAYQMITGNVGMKADPILDDPCSWVVLVDRGIATIESKRLGASRRYADRGWKPRTFLGKCDLSRLSSRRSEADVPLPSWVAPPSAASQTSGLTTTLTTQAPRTTLAPRAPPAAAATPAAPAPETAGPLATKKP